MNERYATDQLILAAQSADSPALPGRVEPLDHTRSFPALRQWPRRFLSFVGTPHEQR